jgi:hypothetical protein
MTAPDGRLAALVLDAGPLIGLLNRRDGYHQDALRGFEHLASTRTVLHVSLPIVIEVFKWLLYRTDIRTARRALGWMLEDLQIFYLGAPDVTEMVGLMMSRSQWTGTLEDVSVVLAAIRLDAPVWTIDYGDLSAFPNLQFWTPG